MGLEIIIAHCSSVSVILPLLLCIVQQKRLTPNLILLEWILIVSFVSDASGLILIQYRINSYFIGNGYLLAQFSLLYFIFVSHFERKLLAKGLYVIIILFFLINIFLFQGPFIFNSVTNVLASLILIGFSVLYLYKVLIQLPTQYIHTSPMLWITFATLAYYGGTFFLFIGKNYLTYGDSGSHRLMWILHNLLNIIKNILFSIGLWQSYRKARSSTLSSSAP